MFNVNFLKITNIFCFDLIRISIPKKVLIDIKDKICKGQYGVFVEKILIIINTIKGYINKKYLDISFFRFLEFKKPTIAKIDQGKRFNGKFHKQ